VSAHLNSVLLSIALVLAVVLVWWGLRSRGTRQADSHSSDNVDTVAGWMPQTTRVLTGAEREAYETLRTALPAHIILAQVPLARFLKVPTRNSYAEWLRRVGHLCADLVVCDRNSLVIAVVEVHAATPVTDDRVLRRQQRLARVLKAAAIPMHVWTEDVLPTPDAAREAIAPTPPATELPATPAAKLAPALSGRFATSAAGRTPDAAAEPPTDEVTELNQAPPSTWFDDLDTGPAPLTRDGLPKLDTPAAPPKDRAAR